MRGNTGARYPDKKRTVIDRRADLQSRLVNSTDQRFAQLTAVGLHQSTGLSIRDCECMLMADRGRRERLAAELAKSSQETPPCPTS